MSFSIKGSHKILKQLRLLVNLLYNRKYCKTDEERQRIEDVISEVIDDGFHCKLLTDNKVVRGSRVIELCNDSKQMDLWDIYKWDDE